MRHFPRSGHRKSGRRYGVAVYCLPLLLAATTVVPSLSFMLTKPPAASIQKNTCLRTSKQSGESGSSSEPICRIVSRADAKLPKTASKLPKDLSQEPYLLEKLDAYYNAQAYKRTKSLSYMEKSRQPSDTIGLESEGDDDDDDDRQVDEDEELLSVVRSSLEDAGFQLLSKRDLDLCDSLNVGYLLRLSISPDVSSQDPMITQQFFPEQFYEGKPVQQNGEEILFGGRCLVFWRGYSEEVTTGRLIIQKLDYLQTSVVRRSAAWVKNRLDEVEMKLSSKADRQSQKLQNKLQNFKTSVVPSALSSLYKGNDEEDEDEELSNGTGSTESVNSARGVNLGRYGGSKLRFVGSPDPDDALDPFIVCEIDYNEEDEVDIFGDSMQNSILQNNTAPSNDGESIVEHDMYEKLNREGFSCVYDEKMIESRRTSPRIHLLERVSINNLVNVFTKYGRRTLLRTLFAKSKLVEPTYEEVVVVWKPLVKEKPKFYPPKFVSDFADIFDIDGFEQPKKRKKTSGGDLQIRNFEGVPMSNIQAVLPKTKLVFRPADALLFDTISLITFALVAGSIRLDSPRLDLLALISVSLWIIRTFLRYSNKLARYDLLVKNFLTSKISHRNEGALKYLSSEAGLQRATRASLVLSWIWGKNKTLDLDQSDGDVAFDNTRSSIQDCCVDEVNQILTTDMDIQIDVERALLDLEDLGLVKFSPEQELIHVTNATNSVDTVKEAWEKLLLERNIKSRNANPKNDVASIVAANLLSDLEENRSPLKAALKKAQKKGYDKVKEILEDEETRKALEQTLKVAQEKGYTKVKEILSDSKSLENLNLSKNELKGALKSAQTKGYTKVKEILSEIYDFEAAASFRKQSETSGSSEKDR